MTDLVQLLGATIANDLSDTQRVVVLAAIDEDQAGVERLAARILAAQNVKSPAAAFYSSIQRGAHLKPAPADERKRRHELTALDMAERRYRAHRSRYPQLGHRDSVEYAVDTTLIDHRSAGLDSGELERALGERLKGAAA